MKRIICILLVLCCTVSLCACGSSNNTSAEDSTIENTSKQISSQIAENVGDVSDSRGNSNITFRGIPFGTSYHETIEMLKEQGIEYSDEDIKFDDYDATYRLNNGKKIQVAGLDMGLELQFASPNQYDGSVPNINDCIFYEAVYTFERVKNLNRFKSIVKDLIDKLELLYGPCVEREDSTHYVTDLGTYYKRLTVWDNDDGVVIYFLAEEDATGETDNIRISYVYEEIKDVVQQQKKEYAKIREQEREALEEARKEEREKMLLETADGL